MASVVPILHNLPSLSHSQPLFSRSTNHKSKFLILSRKPNNSPILLLKCSSSSSSSSMLNKLEEDEEDILKDDVGEQELSPQPPQPPPPPPPLPPLSQVWEEIQGKNNWEGLLDPMDPILRKEITRYGEFAQACYDSFDFDPHSKYCGTCKYHPSHFFEKLDMADSSGYTITRYLYATSNINLPNFFQKSKISSVWSTHANWMGYIAVATDEEEIKRLGRRDIGEHTYLEVTENSSNSKRGVIKVIIEMNFRGEFEIARGNEEYNQLVKRLPEVFVGKSERLRVLVKIMCSAAKKCMKEKKLHLAPWRKQKYMQAKWVGKCDRSVLEPLPKVYETRPTRSKASLLTCDLLLENIARRNCTAVKVI